MTIKCLTPQNERMSTKFDIIAVPAIGANPLVTFRYPGTRPPNLQDLTKWRHMFSPASDARVFLYTFNPPKDPKSYGITKYAEDLLGEIAEEDLGPNRLIHFVGHSTGGIVVKRALVIANGSNKPKILQIRRNCCSIAFFGTPHHGSTVLSQSTYKQAIMDLLKIDTAMSDRVRQNLQNVENIDDMVSFSRVFQPLTINLEKVWSFYETLDSNLQVRARASAGTGTATIKRLVVERRSAALDGGGSARFPDVACEDLVAVKADHSTLPRFGDNPNAKEYTEYLKDLQLQFSTIATVRGEGLDPRWLEHILHVGVHRFHDLEEDSQTTIKLWSVYPLLYDLLEDGPESCLNGRVASAVRPSATPTDQTARTDSSHSPDAVATDYNLPRPPGERGSTTNGNVKPVLKLHVDQPASAERPVNRLQSSDPRMEKTASITTDSHLPSNLPRNYLQDVPRQNNYQDDDAESDTSTPSAYSLPDQSRFRWIQIPCNNLVWVEKIFLAVEKEREKRWFDEVARSTPNTADTEPVPESPAPGGATVQDAPDEVLNDVLENPLASHLLKAKEHLEAKGIEAPDLKEALTDLRKQTHLLKLAQTISTQKQANSIPETTQMIEDTRESRIIVGTAKEQIREGHLPDLSVITQKLREDREKSRLSGVILDDEYLLRKQMISRHGLPHGRYMEPFCQLFLPKQTIEMESIMGETIEQYLAPDPSPIEAPQLCLYMPYLHWDTFGSVQRRTKLVNERLKYPVSLVRNREVERGASLENKLIWQYLVETSDLPLHIRRTLDQFGDPHLEDIQSRDEDQVLFKCTQPPNKDPLTREIFHSVKNRALKAEDAKVLMVDQLWCWIIDSDTVATFFTPKEDLSAGSPAGPGTRSRNRSTPTTQEGGSPKSMTNPTLKSSSPGDLLYQLYTDVNGDQRFASRCFDPFDFVALTVWHAITVFLDRTADQDLQIFTLFEERLCELVEFRNESFRSFRDSQIEASEVFREMGRGSGANRKSQRIIEALNPSYDLTAQIELYDIRDELNMIGNLFSDQLAVVNDLIQSYELLRKANGKADLQKHSQAIRWLKEAKTKVTRYQARVKHLCEVTKAAIEGCESLLDMKQKQSSVIEAYFGRIAAQTQGQQNRSILIFTIFTVIFLPLSFFTSLFSMNVREWTGTVENQTLHTVLTLMVPVSIFVIIAVMFLAFTGPIVNGTKKTAKTTVKTVQNGHKHFHRLRDWWTRRWNKSEEDEDDDAGTKTPAVESGLSSRLNLEISEQGAERRVNL